MNDSSGDAGDDLNEEANTLVESFQDAKRVVG